MATNSRGSRNSRDSTDPKNPRPDPVRRRVVMALAAAGVGTAVFRRALAASVAAAEEAAAGDVTAEMIGQAEWIAGIELNDEDREAAARSLTRTLAEIGRIRAVPLTNDVPIALAFDPAPWGTPAGRDSTGERGQAVPIERAAPQRPASDDDLAFLPVTELAALVRTRQVSSVELTKLYLARLERFDPLLKCVVTLTPELALKQARRADREIKAGRYRGPLHGIPWGAKDLIAVPGYPTTWGAPEYRRQMLDTTAAVARKLDQAGAVLVAKLSLGALAMGDRWFGGQTRNPWDPREGSSGSSAGSAAATVAGLVGFAIGSETHGSILSPARRCGATGLRPTFGRVSRAGCMTLAWSLDKLGPLCRSVEDCALVLGAIHGADGRDASAVEMPFRWPPRQSLRELRVGYVETDTSATQREELRVLKDLGVRLVPIALPRELPTSELMLILDCEAAAAFDDLTRRGVTEGLNHWPAIFRQAEFIPAVEYLRAQRVRTKLMHAMRELMRTVDVTVGTDDLTLTNLTGHPSLSLPNGFRQRDDQGNDQADDRGDGVRTPTALTFTGRLYGETELLALAHAYQQATPWHLERPPLHVHQGS